MMVINCFRSPEETGWSEEEVEAALKAVSEEQRYFATPGVKDNGITLHRQSVPAQIEGVNWINDAWQDLLPIMGLIV